MRLDTIGWRITSIVGAVCAAWVIASLIIGLTGASNLIYRDKLAYSLTGSHKACYEI